MDIGRESHHNDGVASLLLAGGLRSGGVTGRALLHVPIYRGESVMHRLGRQCRRVSPHKPLLLVSKSDPTVRGTTGDWDVSGAVEVQDRDEFRGPGGTVRDACEALPHSVTTLILVEALRWV